jgi:hypothetical protein
MMVMPANYSGSIVHYWAGRYPGRVGWLIGPSAVSKTTLRPWLPFALDNDAFMAWKRQQPWDEAAWLHMLAWVQKSGLRPLWALVPDVVADREATLAAWERYAPMVAQLGWPRAFAVQDGMAVSDVPREADVIFVGGTTDWKWATVAQWADSFPFVHVGRVNELDKLQLCQSLGVASLDGTGWFRATINGRQGTALQRWIEQE